MTKMILSLIVLLVTVAGMDAAQPESSRENLRSLLTDHFATPRHHVTNVTGLEAARVFIYNTWKSYHMQVGRHDFTLEKNGETFPGVNLFALWPGRYFLTPEDQPIIVTAHYETPWDMPGVEDNGSGLAAMLEAARVLTSQKCIQDYTVVFTAFDFSANFERDAQISPCQKVGCGCRKFLDEILLPFLSISAITTENIQGMLVLDGLLNYNNTPGAQRIPYEQYFQTIPGFVDGYNAALADNFRGNSIVVVSREFDSPLADAFITKFNQAGNPQFKTVSLQMPFYNITEQTQQDPLWPLYAGFTDTDIRAIYEAIPEVKALFITDTINNRYREKDWFSLTPDDAMTITDDRLNFLKKTTDSMTRMLIDLSGHKDNCNDPQFELPADFKAGIRMRGTLGMPDGTYQNISLTVPDFTDKAEYQLQGLLIANLSSESWSLMFSGSYDSVEHMFQLHLPEPLDVAGAPFTVGCNVFGRFNPRPRGVSITGRMRGNCGPTLVFPQEHTGPWSRIGEIQLFGNNGWRQSAASSSPSLALPVVLSLLGGMLLSAAVAVALWFVYKRRLANASTNSLPMKEGQ